MNKEYVVYERGIQIAHCDREGLAIYRKNSKYQIEEA